MIPYSKPIITEEDKISILETLESDWIITGPKVEQFENLIADYTNSKYAVAVDHATSGLDIAIRLLNLPKDSEIITTPFTWVGTANVIELNNFKTVFADIDIETRNINPHSIEEKITENTKAIIPVDYAGYPCNYDEIKKIANEHNLIIIQDAAHSLGARYKDWMVGSISDITVFCFGAVKLMTSGGEGGMIVTNNEDYYKAARYLRNSGVTKLAIERTDWTYDVIKPNRKSLLTDIQASMAISQFKYLDKWNKRRNEIAELYNEEFSKLSGVGVPQNDVSVKRVWHLYTLLLNHRREYYEKLRKINIGVNVLYPPIYRFSYYVNKYHINPESYPKTEFVYNKLLAIPLHPSLTNQDIKYIIDSIKNIHRELEHDS